jgi:hypothetical protein
MTTAQAALGKYASSVGLLIDRCVKRELPFGTVWTVGPDLVATCAHLVVMYADFLTALKVRFPALDQEWEVVEAMFHPKFDRKAAYDMAMGALSASAPALALQDYNLVILKLARNLPTLSADAATTFNKRISLAPLPRLKGVGGSVDELGLAVVIQTVTNARKDGTIVIADERNRPLARVFCKEGSIVAARFGALYNEHAVFQMFSEQISGQFNFQSHTSPDWNVGATMARPPESYLMEAHRRMDEIPKMLEDLGGRGAAYVRVADVLNTKSLRDDVRPDAERMWPHLDGGVAIDELWDVVGLDSYSVYQCLFELLRTRQIAELPFSAADDLRPLQPLPLGPHLRLMAWDDVVSLTVHPATGRPQTRGGNLIGLLRPNDPWHLLHNISLPYKAAGSPIFKGGEVIGMHCGLLPLDPQIHALPSHLHLMLWAESIQNCMVHAGSAAVPKKPSVGIVRHPEGNQERSTAFTQCPNCRAMMLKHAKFCGTCGHRLGG